jgi:hypothetical protein
MQKARRRLPQTLRRRFDSGAVVRTRRRGAPSLFLAENHIRIDQ